MLNVWAYEAAARVLFAPWGGMSRLRREVLEALQLPAGARVLEVGCGPGAFTKRLAACGARVHAVDASPAMLAAARRAAPEASYEEADARTYVPHGRFDAVLLSFILHELPVAELLPLVTRLGGALAPRGRVVIVDHAVPPGWPGRVWHAVLRAVESATVGEWIRLDTRALLTTSGFVTHVDRRLAGGRARLLIASRPAAG